MAIRILLVDDHCMVREGLRALLERRPDLSVVGEAGDGREALDRCRTCSPQVVVMDLAMPGLNGLEATRRLHAELPDVKVVVLATTADGRLALEALDAGAAAFLLKGARFEELERAVRAVAAGRSYLGPEVTEAVVEARVRSRERPAGRALELGQREKEVLSLLAEGHTSREIATRLGVTPATVEAHRRNIMRKLDLHSVAALTKYALREGLASLEN